MASGVAEADGAHAHDGGVQAVGVIGGGGDPEGDFDVAGPFRLGPQQAVDPVPAALEGRGVHVLLEVLGQGRERRPPVGGHEVVDLLPAQAVAAGEFGRSVPVPRRDGVPHLPHPAHHRLRQGARVGDHRLGGPIGSGRVE